MVPKGSVKSNLKVFCYWVQSSQLFEIMIFLSRETVDASEYNCDCRKVLVASLCDLKILLPPLILIIKDSLCSTEDLYFVCILSKWVKIQLTFLESKYQISNLFGIIVVFLIVFLRMIFNFHFSNISSKEIVISFY